MNDAIASNVRDDSPPLVITADGFSRSQVVREVGTPDEAKFWARVDRGEPDKCWEWIGTRSPRGYGACYVRSVGGSRAAHRVSWVLAHGPIAEGLEVCHRCDNPPCVNP